MKLFILCQCNGIAITQSIDCVRQVPLGSKSVCPDSILIRAPRVTLGTGHRKAWFVITASIRHYSFKSDSRPHRPSLLVTVDRSFQNPNHSYSLLGLGFLPDDEDPKIVEAQPSSISLQVRLSRSRFSCSFARLVLGCGSYVTRRPVDRIGYSHCIMDLLVPQFFLCWT